MSEKKNTEVKADTSAADANVVDTSAADTSVKKDIRIEINGLNDKKFVLSGPSSSVVELENVAYALMSEIIIFKWRDNFVRKEKENTRVEDAEKAKKDIADKESVADKK